MKKITLTVVVILFTMSLLVSGCAKKASEDNPIIKPEPTVVVEEQAPVVVDNVNDSQDVAAKARAAEIAAANGLVRIQFDFDQYVLTADAKQILQSNASLLAAAPAVKVLIEGHCDERGSDEYNLALGEKRALATKSYLVSLGIAASRMNVISYGEEMPIDPASTSAAWAQNRRANFKVKR